MGDPLSSRQARHPPSRSAAAYQDAPTTFTFRRSVGDSHVLCCDRRRTPKYRGRFERMSEVAYLQMHFALDGIPEFAPPYELLNDPDMQSNIGIFSTPEELQQQWEDCRRGIVPADPAIALQIPSVNDPGLAPPGKHAASAFSLWFPPADARSGDSREETQSSYGEMKVEMGRRVIRLAPNFESLIIRHTTFTPKHMGTMFGAPGGDYCHGLIHPDQIGINRPGPKGYVGQPIPIDGLYLASAGCHRRPWYHLHSRLQRRRGGARREGRRPQLYAHRAFEFLQ